MITSIADVRQIDILIDTQMTALNEPLQACAGITAADKTTWTGFYGSWQILHSYWNNLDQAAWMQFYATDLLVASSVYNQMSSYAAALPAWQQKTAAACPGTYTVPAPIALPQAPNNPNAPKPFDWEDFIKVAGGIVTTVALAGIVYKGLTIVEDFTSNVRK